MIQKGIWDISRKGSPGSFFMFKTYADLDESGNLPRQEAENPPKQHTSRPKPKRCLCQLQNSSWKNNPFGGMAGGILDELFNSGTSNAPTFASGSILDELFGQ